MDEEAGIKQETRWKEVEHPTFYGNLVAFSMTPFDISLLLGEVESATDKEVVGIPRAKLILAPELVAKLVQVLALALEAYVEANGPLRGSMIDSDHIRQLIKNRGHGQ